MLNMDETQISAFWSKVGITDNPKDCWEWRGAKKPKGYGNLKVNGKYMLAHRVAFELTVGSIPDGFMACHICDNPSCCNPSHIMLGTPKSNAIDMLIKNRQVKFHPASRGERNCNSKLTTEAVKEIRRAYEAKEANQYELAKIYGVSQHSICSVVKRQTWRHV